MGFHHHDGDGKTRGSGRHVKRTMKKGRMDGKEEAGTAYLLLN